MRLDRDRCLACGLLDTSVAFCRDYGFCSQACYEKFLSPHMEPRYRFDKQIEDDDWFIEQCEKHQENSENPNIATPPDLAWNNFVNAIFNRPLPTPEEYIFENVKRDSMTWHLAQLSQLGEKSK